MHIRIFDSEDRLYWLKSQRWNTCWFDGFAKCVHVLTTATSILLTWKFAKKGNFRFMPKMGRKPLNVFAAAAAATPTARAYLPNVFKCVYWKAIFTYRSKLESWLADSLFRSRYVLLNRTFDWNSNGTAAKYAFIANGYQSHLWLGVVFDIDQSVCW